MRLVVMYWPMATLLLIVALRVVWVLKFRARRKGKLPPEA